MGDKVQTAFSDPSASVEFKMGPNGFVSPLNMILALREASSHSGMLHTNWYNFSRFCLRNVRKTPGQVMSYPDGVMGILNDIEKITYSNRRTTVRWLEGNGDEAKLKSEHMGCVDAGDKIKEQVEEFLSEDSKQLSKALTKAQKAGAGENPAGMKELENLIAQINVKGLKRGVEVAANILFWQTTNDVFNCGHLTLDPASYTSCASLLHDQQQTWAIDSAAAGSGFGRTVMASSSFLLALFFSLGPFVLLVVVAMASQGFGLLVKYIIFGIWTQSWIPVAHIVNYFIIFSWKSSLERLEKAYEASGYTGKTLPLESVPRILSETVDAIAIAADLFAAVPLITLAVFTGSYFAFTRIADRFSSRDYTNERMIQPPPMQPAALAGMDGPVQSLSPHAGTGRTTGAPAQTISVSQAASASVSSSRDEARQQMADVSRMIGQNFTDSKDFQERYMKETGSSAAVAASMAKIAGVMKDFGFGRNEGYDTSDSMTGKTASGVNLSGGAQVRTPGERSSSNQNPDDPGYRGPIPKKPVGASAGARTSLSTQKEDAQSVKDGTTRRMGGSFERSHNEKNDWGWALQAINKDAGAFARALGLNDTETSAFKQEVSEAVSAVDKYNQTSAAAANLGVGANNVDVMSAARMMVDNGGADTIMRMSDALKHDSTYRANYEGAFNALGRNGTGQMNVGSSLAQSSDWTDQEHVAVATLALMWQGSAESTGAVWEAFRESGVAGNSGMEYNPGKNQGISDQALAGVSRALDASADNAAANVATQGARIQSKVNQAKTDKKYTSLTGQDPAVLGAIGNQAKEVQEAKDGIDSASATHAATVARKENEHLNEANQSAVERLLDPEKTWVGKMAWSLGEGAARMQYGDLSKYDTQPKKVDMGPKLPDSKK